MKLEKRPFSFVSNKLWLIIVLEICRLYRQYSEDSTEDSLRVMAEIMDIWKCRTGMRLVICSADKQYSLFIDGSSNGAIVRIMNIDFVWEIRLEDRKWIYGSQIVKLFDLLKIMEETETHFTFA